MRPLQNCCPSPYMWRENAFHIPSGLWAGKNTFNIPKKMYGTSLQQHLTYPSTYGWDFVVPCRGCAGLGAPVAAARWRTSPSGPWPLFLGPPSSSEDSSPPGGYAAASRRSSRTRATNVFRASAALAPHPNPRRSVADPAGGDTQETVLIPARFGL